jgi:hypothetical protein
MAKRKARSQTDNLTPNHKMLGIDMTSMRRWRAAHRWKAFDESYNFALDLIPIGGLSTKL